MLDIDFRIYFIFHDMKNIPQSRTVPNKMEDMNIFGLGLSPN